jgi:hypothetical protein
MKRFLCAVAAIAFLTLPATAGEIGHANLDILGLSLEVVTDPPIATGIDIPAVIQTKFGGKMNADAPPSPGFLAVGELTGPGIDTPILITTQPGHTFELPALRRSGDYTLQNIRLVTAPAGQFVQQAVPSSVNINVSDVLKPSVTVRQLTPDDLRNRGITIDSRNYDYYEYTFVFAVKGQNVVVPYTVVVDKRTNQALPPADNAFNLPSPRPGSNVPPRFEQPNIGGGVLVPDQLPEAVGLPDAGGGGGPGSDALRRRPTIPAAIVLPSNFGVLHQFFAVILNVTNNAPAGTSIELDSVRAVMTAPQALRISKIEPAVSIGQAVPVRAADGSTFLVAQAEGSAEWTLEALRAGTHTLKIELNATYRAPNQPDIAMHGVLPATISVSDPRFQINFVHPDTIRANENYTAYAFVTNTSSTPQTVTLNLDSHIPLCSTGGSAFGICVVEALSQAPVTIASGATITVPYKLQSKITGHIFATAGTADETISLSVALSMGVSASGVPLSPATLLMPSYAQYIDQTFVSAYMPLLGLGYSLATAPVSAKTAQFPRLIRTDIFRRAQDIARAGQRSFIARRNRAAATADEDREPVFHLALDLLCNVERRDLATATPSYGEWDQFRRMEESGRTAGAATARLLESVAFAGGRSMSSFVSDFATATSHRTPFALALVHAAARPSLTVKTAAGATLANASDLAAPWKREIPFAELTQFNGGGEQGELAMIGRWGENLRISVVPASSSFTVELLYPDAADGSLLQAKLDISGAVAGQPVTFNVDRAAASIAVSGATASTSIHPVAQTPLNIVAAAQDIALDPTGRTVTLLMNRPLHVTDEVTLRDNFTISTAIAQLSYDVTRRNDAKQTPVPGAALQEDGRLIVLTFSKSLSSNATYRVGTITPLRDLANDSSSIGSTVVPRIDDNRPAGVVYGNVLLADNTPVKQATVQLASGDGLQFDITDDNGAFLFEYVARDPIHDRSGYYTLDTRSADGKAASLEGSIRLVGELQHVNLVFIGRGSAQGYVRYSDGEAIAGARVSVGNSLYGDIHTATTDANGFYSVSDLAVGPVTFAAVDAKGTVTYATAQLRVAGGQLAQDLVVQRRTTPGGFGRVRVTVRRSDRMSDPDPKASLVPGAHVGVYSQGYGLLDGFTDSAGQAFFDHVPAGQISVLAAEFSVAKRSNGAETDLKPDQLVEQTVILEVPPVSSPQFVTVRGIVFRDDPAAPRDDSRVTPVAGAVVTFKGFPPVTADSQGRYVDNDVPVSYSNGSGVYVFDPSTSRQGWFAFPTLRPGEENTLDLKLSSKVPVGKATMRVRVVSATGEPVDGYTVISPGYPPDVFTGKGGGVYERIVDIPQSLDVWAIGINHPKYGDQTVHGNLAVDFDGQIAAIELRLPGQGTIVTRTEILGTCSVPGCTPQWTLSPGTVRVTYRAWSNGEQMLVQQDKFFSPGADGLVRATNIPAREGATVETFEHPGGFASADATLGFEGDLKTVNLRLTSLGDVTGRIVNYDGTTPVAGASVRLEGGAFDGGTVTTLADGSFIFPAIAANKSFRITAKALVDGVARTGYVDSATPRGGGPVSGLVIVMRQQAKISGTIRDSHGAPVPLAHYWVRQLAWPYGGVGSPQEPLIADSNGAFFANNIFSGPFRVTAVSPIDPTSRGDLQGDIAQENDDRNNLSLVIGAAGTGTVNVTVYDSNSGFTTVPNAEVSLQISGRGYDFTVTDASGFAVFEEIPVGRYMIRAISRAVGRTGASQAFDVTRDAETNVRVSLTFIGTVAGTIVDADNDPPTPVVGAAVFLRGSSGLDVRASTDSTGHYVFNAVPEGRFSIAAMDIVSGRQVTTGNDYELSTLVQNLTIAPLSIERGGTINLTVSLPNDAGAAGEIAPLVDVTVSQATSYQREQQGSGSMVFNKLFTSHRFNINVRELGGEQRVMNVVNATFAAGTRETNIALVFPATGSVEVTVLGENEQPMRGVVVIVSDGFRTLTAFSNDNGIARFDGVPLHHVVVRATSGNISASDGGTLASRSTPLTFRLHLGNRISVAGKVFAEEGVNVPSVGTSVIATVSSPLFQFGSVTMQTRTDANGEYRFGAVPISNTTISLTFVGPDEATAGDRITSFAVPNGQTGELRMRDAKLDATPPRVVSIEPADNANSVSPTASIVIAFSEPLGGVASSSFSLVSTDNGASTATTMTSGVVNGVFRVTLTPTAKLRSNIIYRVVVNQTIHDVTGNFLKAAVGSSFTTVDYTEPRVISVTPSTINPIPDGTTFRLKFNKPIDATAFATGGSGTLTLQRLKTYKGELLEPVNASVFADPSDAAALNVAPIGVAIQPSSYYRITVNGARDTQPIPAVQTIAQTFDFFSFDTLAPTVTIQSPVPAGSPLIVGQSYTFVPLMSDGAKASTDIAWVDWTFTDGTTSRVKTGNFSITRVMLATSDNTYTLNAKATDLSGNESAVATATFTVAANEAPKNVVVTTTTASTYLGRTIAAHVAFSDEGTLVTTKLAVSGTNKDGSPFTFPDALIHPKVNQQITRKDTATPWAGADYTIDVPGTLKTGTTITITATVVDSVNKTSDPATASVAILADSVAPQVSITAPVAETQYSFGTGTTTFTIKASALDAESGIARLTFAYDGKLVDLGADKATRPADGSWLFTTAATVTKKNVDTRIHITATAYDYDGNTEQQVVDVIYKSVGITNVPKAAWITPLDGAALVAGETNLPLKLRIRATAEPAGYKPAVHFTSDAFVTAPPALPGPTSGNDIYEQTVNVNVPASGSFTIELVVDDEDESHRVIVPITIDALVPDAPVVVSSFEINDQNLSTYQDKTVVVRGAATRLNIDTPTSLRNLIVLEGATVGTRDGVRLDATITDRVYVDGSSSINVSGKGYRGGWQKSDDGTFTNDSPNGITFGGTTTGGATSGASASHAGMGGEVAGSSTNATYGSITTPATFGAGGAGAPASGTKTPGGNGGGAMSLHADAFVIAGAIRADGESADSRYNAGAGGSLLLSSRALVTGPETRITANGGDDTAGIDSSRGAGGGRIAIAVAERLELDSVTAELQARGGRNNTTTEGRRYVDGGAGTLFLRAPGSTLGELRVSSYDDRQPASTHVTRATPIAGTTAFDTVTIGPRALARFDDAYPATITVDPTAVALQPDEVPTLTFSSTPANGQQLVRGSNLSTTYDAKSNAGVATVVMTFTPAGTLTPDAYTSYPLDTLSVTRAIPIPLTAPLGAATFNLRVTDRAGRTADIAPVALTLIDNLAPSIDKFAISPATLVDPIALTMYAGHKVTATISASDDAAITKFTFLSTLAGVAATPIVTTPNTKTIVDSVFNVDVPAATTGGTQLKLDATVEDNVAEHKTTVTKTISILPDTIAPSVTVTKPVVTSTILDEAVARTIDVEATVIDAQVAVKQVFATVDGQVFAMTAPVGSNVYTATVPMPDVTGTSVVDVPVTVTALDYANNSSTSSTINVHVQPFNDPNAPVVTWLCPGTVATYPAGYAAKLRVRAIGNSAGVASNTVTKVDLIVTLDGVTTTVSAPRIGTSTDYEGTFTIPAATAEGAIATVKAVATNVASLTSSASMTFTSVIVAAADKLTASTTIASTDTSRDAHNVWISGATTIVTLNGAHTFRNLILLDGAKITQAITTATLPVPSVSATATGSLYVACGCAIDVSLKGYQDSVNGVGRTWPGATTNGPTNRTGGSHGGEGGVTAGGVAAASYGSAIDPSTPGGSGSTTGTITANQGGGVIRLQAPTVAIDGSLLANGNASGLANNPGGSGAGGSIRIDANTLTGVGVIHADSPTNGISGGSGGRVALYYRTFGLTRANITATTAKTGTAAGAAGTIYFRRNDANGAKLSDELLVAGTTASATASARVADLGSGTITSVSGTSVTLSGTVPEFVEGSLLEVTSASGVVTSYTIASRGADSHVVNLLTVPVSIAAGQTYRGVWSFDAITVTGAQSFRAGGLRTPLVTTDATSFLRPAELRSTDLVVHGRIESPSITATNATIANGSLIAHEVNDSASVRSLTMNVSATLTVDATSAIDATGRGYTAGRTWPFTTVGASSDESGGSHGGTGGGTTATTALPYGSLFDPNEPGGAGATGLNLGGGIVRINAGTIALAGSIAANGQGDTSGGSGAGGSIRIDAGAISGTGSIRANGGESFFTNNVGGGGGRIAIYASSIGIPAANLTAIGGRDAAPGTIFTKLPAQSYGDLTVSNGTVATTGLTSLTSLGFGTVTSFTGDSVTDASANFAAPNVLTGIGLILNNDTTKRWPVVTNSATTIRVTPDSAFLPATGMPFRGMYRFDHVTLVNARLQTDDILITESTPVRDAASTLASGNAGAPLINLSAIQIVNGAFSTTIAGSAGAVVDPDAPVIVFITNTRTNLTTSNVVASDGSFAVGISGVTGDVFTIRATDAHRLPLTSATFTIGALTADTRAPSQLPLASFGVDATFRPRALATAGRTLAVISDASASSDKVALFDTTSPLAPTQIGVVSIGDGANRCVVIDHGWVFVGATRLNAFQLGVPTPTVIHSTSGTYSSLAVIGHYLYGGQAGSGSLRLFDITNPAAPSNMGSQSFLSNISGDASFTSLIPIGTKYIAGITAGKSTNGVGHDVVIIDVHSPDVWTLISDFDVPSFDASRGVLSGNVLHLVSATGSEEVLVDVTDVAHPAVIGRVAIGQFGRGVDAAARHAYAAVGSGLSYIDATTSTAPQFGGSLPVGANANDVRIGSGAVYVAHDNGLAIVSANEGPVLAPGLVTVSFSNGIATAAGAAGAVIGGSGAITLELRAGVTAGTATANADGSFVATVAAALGDEPTIKAIDAAGNSAGPYFLGIIPIPQLVMTTANITVSFDGTNATVTGVVGAITGGKPPVKAAISNRSRSATVNTVTVNADGSFTGAVTAISGDSIGVTATDAALTIVGPTTVGRALVPLVINTALVSSTFTGGTVHVVGAASAVTGTGSIRVTIATPAKSSFNFAAANGSFSVDVAGVASGDPLTITATDGAPATAGPLSIGNVPVGPVITAARITVSRSGLVTGTAGAVTGAAPLTMTLRAGTATTAPFTPNADGSFAATVGGATFDRVIVTLTDATQTTSLDVGAIPAAFFIIDTTRVTVAAGGVVTGTTGAVTADPPFVVTARAGTSTPTTVTLNADGSFSAIVVGNPGDRVTLTVADGAASVSRDVGGLPTNAALAITPAMTGGDANFFARTLAFGGNALVAVSYPDASGVGSSDKLLLFDATAPLNPVYRQTFALGSATRSVVIDGGWAFAGTATGLTAIDLGASPSMHAVSCGCSGPSNGVAVVGHYAYTINGNSLVEYDVTAPAAPVVSRIDDVNAAFRSIIAVDNRYLVLLTAATASNNLRVFDTVVHDIIGFTSLFYTPIRGRASGSLVYVTGENGGGSVVDLTNPQQPATLALIPANSAGAFGVDSYGSAVAVASGTAGARLFNAAASMQSSGFVNAQPAWDVAYNTGALYIATETSLNIASAQSQPPVIDTSRIRVTGDASAVTVTGSRGAVLGESLVQTTLRHGATDVQVLVQSDGSFTLQFTATPGEALTIRTSDNQSRGVGPISIGSAPYGGFRTITTAMTDAAFRARQLVTTGTTLLVASRDTASDAIVIYDISSPAAPSYKQTLHNTLGAVQNMTAAAGRAFVSYERGITMIDLRGATPVVTALPQPDGVPGALTVLGNYLFVSTSNAGASSMVAYDVTDPAAIRLQSTSETQQPASLRSLIALDATHLAGAGVSGAFFGDVSSIYQPGSGYSDIPDAAEGVAAIGAQRVFMTNAAHKLREWQQDDVNGTTTTSISTAGAPHGIDAAGTTLYVADGAAGLSLIDASSALHPALQRSLAVGGTAWDVRVGRGVVYVAADGGVAVIGASDITVEPTIDARAVTVQTDGTTTATITGAANAIGSGNAATVHVTSGANTTINATVDAFGAFTALTLTAPPGGALVAHVDSASKSTQRPLSPVPFANTVASYAMTTAKSGDANARFRRIAVDGTRLVATHGYPYNSYYYTPEPAGSDALFIFDTTQPIATQTPVIVRVGSHIQDFVVANGVAYVAAGDFLTVDLATTAVHRVTGHGGALRAVAISGNYAFAGGARAGSATDAPLQIYDITNPAAPAFVREQVIVAGEEVWGIRALDARYLAFFTDGSDGFLRIVDRQNINTLAPAASLSSIYVAGGVVSGNTFYVYGDYSGVTAIDITDRTHPAIVGSVDTQFGASSIAISGTNELAVADGVAGVTFIDAADRTALHIKGTQQLPGAPADLVAVGKTIYVASEFELDAITRP